MIHFIKCCRSVDNYTKITRINEGSYGVVYLAQDNETREKVALKRIKPDQRQEGFPLTSLREIKILMKCKHANLLNVKEIVIGDKLTKVYMVMEYVDHDLSVLMKNKTKNWLESEVKCLMLQLLRGIKYLHDNWIIHRDIKTSNLLLNNKGILKLADFGMAREYGDPIKQYTPLVVTLWYRAPELLLGAKTYGTEIDMWSVGCVFAELLNKEPLFPGNGELDQLDKIFRLLGTANEKIWPGFNDLPMVKKVNFKPYLYNNLKQPFQYLSTNGFDLLNGLLTYDPKKRFTAEEALEHPYFKEKPLPKQPRDMPFFAPTNKGDF
ncbi:cyclin-dependent kinase 11a-related [Anaeramoeba flamelloides]|uniref:cyclin-dependent kinase n=1 Tax=Anaeramoeba flamelloides TaxID=1746091 RepID=A0AAV8A2B9_9EUKA|nr:cyclin-dependent kinase 11a-related [Anaeramoeba flamelloides]KAJ6228646.1 cyclin-dependent kinase 11a-related [Anaeramoeba flamelloides]